MFTFHHGFWVYFFARRHKQVWQFVIGSMLPDYVYLVLLAVLLLRGQLGLAELPGLSPTVFMTYIPQHPWAIHADLAGHSAVVWGAAFVASLLPVANRFQALVVGWGTHILIDGLTHAAHANLFLYPLTLLAVHSPVSYWEPAFFAREFRLVNGALMGLATGYLLYRWWKRRRREE